MLKRVCLAFLKLTFQYIHAVRLALLLAVSVAGLAGCNSPRLNNPGSPPLDSMQRVIDASVLQDNQLMHEFSSNRQIDQAVHEALMPAPSFNQVALTGKAQYFDVSADSVPARAFFMSLVKGTDENITVNPKISGTITLDLKHVTLEQVLAAVKDNYGYQYHKTPYGYEVYPSRLESRVYTVNYLNAVRNGGSYVAVDSGLISQERNQETTSTGTINNTTQDVSTPSSSVKTTSTIDFWPGLKAALEAIIGAGENTKERVVIEPASGLVVVTAPPAMQTQVAHYIDRLNGSMSREVMIEAEILKVTLSKGFQSGINWTLLGATQVGNTNLTDSLSSFTPIFTLSGKIGSLNTVISLLSTQGNVQVLSSPRISAINNQKAVIKVGTDEYFITDVSNTVSGSGSDAQSTQDVTMQPFFSGISLGVTPTITQQGNVYLQIHPIVSTVTDASKTYTLNGASNTIPSAKSDIDESDSVVYARSGQVIVLGGLIQNQSSEYLGSTPFLAKIPFVGALFRQTNQSSTKEELVILLKPVVVNDERWAGAMQQTQADYRNFRQGYHFGTFPQRFGNTGEMQGLHNMPLSKPQTPTPLPAVSPKHEQSQNHVPTLHQGA